MMSIVLKTVASVGILTLSISTSDLAVAKLKYLLNCRLMDRNEPVYARYCTGENSKQLRLVCQDDKLCLFTVANFRSRYMGPKANLITGSNGGISRSPAARSSAPPSDPEISPPQ
jgi:hypothetical protein